MYIANLLNLYIDTFIMVNPLIKNLIRCILDASFHSLYYFKVVTFSLLAI